MRKRVATAALAAAMAGFFGVPPHPLLAQTAAGQPANAASAPGTADQHAAIPVKQVVLYSSGVGYFEHFGTVKGSGTTELRFKAAQVNDILKSLVLQDLDKGRVGVITYPSQDPVAKTLRSFQIDITGNPSVPDLLNQLRGAKVTVAAGGDKATGTVLGVERKPRPVGTGESVKVIEVPFLNLIADDGGIRSVSLEDVRGLELLDKKLQDELNRALAALAGARDQDKKPVNISLQGDGERRVRIGYVVETPVWKTSYRLILTGDGGVDGGKKDDDKPAAPNLGVAPAGGAEVAADGRAARRESLQKTSNELQLVIRALKAQLGGENHPTIVSRQRELDSVRAELAALGAADGKAGIDANASDAGKAAAAGKSGTGSLQGWAIVENQTDNDWNDVQLSLVSGRPISFVQDLYQPLYVPRPVVMPELYASLRPQTYDAAMGGELPMAQFGPPRASAAAFAPSTRPAGGAVAAKRAFRGPALQEAEAAFDIDQFRALGRRENLGVLDATASVSSLASAAKMGELFQYTVGSVSLPRQTSAMIPVVTDPVEVERLSIYNASVLPKNPLLGARVKNTTGKHLLQGPVTVLDGGAYAGDARIDDLPPGQERLVSYGVDQQVLVQAVNTKQENAVQTGKVVKGVLQLKRKLVASQEYTAENKGDKGKTLVIEHPRRGGGWKLAEPAKADETTDSLYRFKGSVQAGKGTKLAVREELVTTERVQLLSVDDGTLDLYVRTGEIPQEVRDALSKVAKFRQDLAATRQQVQQRRQKIDTITKEQTRLRDNMKTVAQNTEYYKRLLKKLDEQESTIEGLQKEAAGLETQAETQRTALEDYVNGLSVG